MIAEATGQTCQAFSLLAKVVALRNGPLTGLVQLRETFFKPFDAFFVVIGLAGRHSDTLGSGNEPEANPVADIPPLGKSLMETAVVSGFAQ